MHRFYISNDIAGDTAIISDAEQLHHLRDVLRLKSGDEVTVFDTQGREYLCTITGLAKKQAVLQVNSKKVSSPKSSRLAMACAIPKKSKFDDIVDKLTQLGVDVIIPLETARVVVKLEENREIRLARWRKIALSAAEQSRRNSVPEIQPKMTFRAVLAQSKEYEIKLISTTEGERKAIRESLDKLRPTSILILVGPEGDFTSQEVNEAIETGFTPISLGDSILRVETAAIAIASYLKFTLMQ